MEDGKQKCSGKYGCGEIKSLLDDFAKTNLGKKRRIKTCKACWNKRARELAKIRFEKQLRLEIGKNRPITETDRIFFKLGVLKGQEGLNDIKKALAIEQRANRAILEVINTADERDQKARIGG